MVPLAGMVGLFVGSFLNVVIYRTPLGLSVAAPRSFCPTCDRQLLWWENIPVVSWLGLQGRCHTCHEPISIRYPLVETVTGVTFSLTTWAWHGTILAAAYCVLAASMIAVGLIEYGGQRAPLSVAGVGTGLAEAIIVAGGAWQHRWTAMIGSLVGAAVGLAIWRVLQHTDPTDESLRGHGRSALLPVGCWAGGLGSVAAASGASGWLVTYAACLVGVWAVSHQTVSASSAPVGPGRPTRFTQAVTGTPLVTSLAVAMIISLVVGA